MKDPLISDIVRVSLFECYVHHAINKDRKTLLARLGRVKFLIRQAGADGSLLLPNARNELEELERAALIGEARSILDEFDLDTWQAAEIDIEDDLFLEYLVNCIRNDVISYQVFISNSFNKTKNGLIADLHAIKNSDSVLYLGGEALIEPYPLRNRM